jgi:hypothetical protein
MKHLIPVIIIIAFFLTGCPKYEGTSTVQRTLEVPEFLYVTENGEFRSINIEYTRRDTTIGVSKFSTVGPLGGYYGQVANDYIGQFAWTKYEASDSMPKVSAILRNYNNTNPAYNRLYERQYVYVNQNERPYQLEFFSVMDNQLENLTHWNYPIQGAAARSTDWIDQNSFVMLYTDVWNGFKTGIDKPANIPYSSMEMYILRYDVSGLIPSSGEIITAFTVGDNRAGDSTNVFNKNKPVDPHYAQLLVSANAEFYIVWFPKYNKKGYTPYIIRNDGSMALNPTSVHYTWENRYFGQSMFAMEASPTQDSLYVIGDNNYKQVKVVKLPQGSDQPFEEIYTRTVGQVFAGAGSVKWSAFQKRRAWFMKYKNDGRKVAMTHSLPGVQPQLSVWDTSADTMVTYRVNRSDFGERYHTMGAPAWAHNSENQNIVYFIATDTTGNDRGDLFYVDTSKRSTYARRVNWSGVDFLNIARENINFSSDLLGR